MKIPLFPGSPIAALSEKTIKTIEAVPSVNNTQIALLLLRQINNGSLTYTLRTATPCSTEGITQTFTKKILQALAKILDCPLQDVSNASARVFLPIGPGLGFSPTAALAPLAFNASFLQATTLLNSLDENTFPIPKHPPLRGPEMSHATLYQRLIAEAFKHVDLLKDPNVKL